MTHEATADFEPEKKQSWLQSAFSSVMGGFGLSDMWQEFKEEREWIRGVDEVERQVDIKSLYESVYTQSQFTGGEGFKNDLERIIQINEHCLAYNGRITFEDLSNYHLLLSDDKKAELDQLRTAYQQEKNNHDTPES